MEIEIKSMNPNVVVRIRGELDHSNCEEVRNKIDREMLSGKSKNIIFDLKNLEFMDSSGIGVIIGRYKKTLIKNGKVLIVGMKPQVKSVYDICGLHKIIPWCNSVEEAIEKL